MSNNLMCFEKLEQFLIEGEIDDGNKTTKDILKKIITIDSKKIDSKIFFDCFYVDNEEMKSLEDEFQKILNKDRIFKFFHGYSKSGKTTFIKHFFQSDDSKSDLIIELDFERPNSSNYIDKIKRFYEMYFIISDKIITIKDTIKKIKYDIGGFIKSDINENVKIMFYDSILMIAEKILEIMSSNKFGEGEGRTRINNDKFKSNFQTNFLTEINNDNVHKYFTFLVFYKFYKNKDQYCDSKFKKIIILIDNIDENLNTEDLTFLKQPQFEFSKFVHQFINYLGLSTKFNKSLCKDKAIEDKFEIGKRLKVIYVFRSPNFLVFINAIQKMAKGTSGKNFQAIEEFIDRKNILQFLTFNNIGNILKQRLNVYETFINEYNNKYNKELKKSNIYTFLKLFSSYIDDNTLDKELFEENTNNNIGKLNNILYLWNGDISDLFSSINKNFDSIEERFLYNSSIIKNLSDLKEEYEEKKQKEVLEVLRGIFLHFFIFLLKNYNSPNGKEYDGRIYKHAITLFRDKELGKVKNINRMILNLILHNTNKNKEHHDDHSIEHMGIGFFDLLSAISSFINNINKLDEKSGYNFKQVEDFFNDLSHIKINSSKNLFSIYKNQLREINGEYVTDNMYNLNVELKLFNNTLKIEKEINKKRNLIKEKENLLELYKQKLSILGYSDKSDDISTEIKKQEEINEFSKKQEEIISELDDLNKKKNDLINEKERNKIELNNIRIVGNHNAAFISYSLLSQFELFSFTNSNIHKNNSELFPNNHHPPLFLSLFGIDDNSINVNKFFTIIDEVYEDAEVTINKMIDFYINFLIQQYPPDEFEKSNYFSINDNGIFQIQLIVSRHIRYLNYHRDILLIHRANDSYWGFTPIQINYINKKIKETVIKYCDLFVSAYRKIDKKYTIPNDTRLHSGYLRFQEMKEFIKTYLKNEDFTKSKEFTSIDDFKKDKR